MSSIQERLQLKRVPLDKWSTREQLCLASAVACSGDQNWMSVSRSLKMICGSNRPSDWFSQKSCAAQYGKLLENVETPKRKKRTGTERDSSGSVDTPGESIVRKLTQERITELKKLIQENHKEHTKLKEECLMIQNNLADENKLREMWAQIEMEKKHKEKEQQLHAQWLKEREERKLELERAWRPNQHLYQSNSPTPSSPRGSPSHSSKPGSLANLKIKQEEMEIDDNGTKQGTSPLLTSLLKSPSPAPNPAAVILQTAIHSPTTSRAAPTITNLLTGNTTNVSTTSASAIISPIIIPAALYSTQFNQATDQTPSQAAPTLSMLLDTKSTQKTEQLPSASQQLTSTNQQQLTVCEVKIENLQPVIKIENIEPQIINSSPEGNTTDNKDDDQQLMEVFNGLIPDIPDNIDELADILTENNEIILSPELDSLIDEQDTEEKPKDKESTEISKNDAKLESFLKEDKINVIVDSEEYVKMEEKDDIKMKDNIITEEMIIIENVSSEADKVPKSAITIALNTTTSAKTVNEETIEIDETEKSIAGETEKSEDSDLLIEKIIDSEKKTDQAMKQEDVSEKNSDESHLQKSNVTTISKSDDIVLKPSEIKREVIIDDDIYKPAIDLEEDNIKKMDDIKGQSPINVKQEIDESKNIKSDDRQSTKEEAIDQKIRRKEQEIVIKKHTTSKDESKSDIIQLIPTVVVERRISSDDEIFEDAKESIGDIVKEEIDSSHPEVVTIQSDDDSPIEVIKEDKIGKTKRDYSRKKPTLSIDSKKSEDSNEDNKSNLSIRMKLKDRERSESPLVTDDDANDMIPRTRRRYSSTPVIDSIPNSPASSDDREYKAWKKSILVVYNRLSTHKYASVFLRPFADDQTLKYKSMILRPMDLQTIKRNIETGVIRTTAEFQRDVMLMCQNAIMVNKIDNNVFTMAKEMMIESNTIVDSIMESWKKEYEKTTAAVAASTSQGLAKIRGRKSQRIPAL